MKESVEVHCSIKTKSIPGNWLKGVASIYKTIENIFLQQFKPQNKQKHSFPIFFYSIFFGECLIVANFVVPLILHLPTPLYVSCWTTVHNWIVIYIQNNICFLKYQLLGA